MSNIHIEWLSDTSDCETCGPSYAEGATVTIGGKVAFNFEPAASCCSPMHWDRDTIYLAVLANLGHRVTES